MAMQRTGRTIHLEVDGGVKVDNIRAIAEAGADTFVAGSAIFDSPDYRATIAQMRARARARPRRPCAKSTRRWYSRRHSPSIMTFDVSDSGLPHRLRGVVARGRLALAAPTLKPARLASRAYQSDANDSKYGIHEVEA